MAKKSKKKKKCPECGKKYINLGAHMVAHEDKVREDWDDIKLDIMKKILHEKVNQHPYVKKKLLESGDKELIENSWRDSYWGWGPNKDGHNHLGKLWMEVREEVKNNE